MVTRIVQGWKELDTNSTILGDIEIGDGQLRTFGEAVKAVAVGDATNVPSNTLTTVVTLVSNGTNMVTTVGFSGEDYAKFGLYINSVLIDTYRTGPQRNGRFYFEHPYALEVGDVIDVKVTHWFAGETLDFESTMYGFKYVVPTP
jgi:hypothetical protein